MTLQYLPLLCLFMAILLVLNIEKHLRVHCSTHQVSFCFSSDNVLLVVVKTNLNESLRIAVLLVPIMCTKFLYEIMYCSECKCGILGLT